MITLDDIKHILPDHLIKRLTILPDEKYTGCWEFNGDPSSNGYMRCWFKGKRYMVHRLFYEFSFRRDIRKLQLDHLCENRVCCNPNHMDPVTNQVNAKRRTKRRKTPMKTKDALVAQNEKFLNLYLFPFIHGFTDSLNIEEAPDGAYLQYHVEAVEAFIKEAEDGSVDVPESIDLNFDFFDHMTPYFEWKEKYELEKDDE